MTLIKSSSLWGEGGRGNHLQKLQMTIVSEGVLARSLGDLCYLVSSVDGSFASRHRGSQHQLRLSSGCGLSCVGLNQFLWNANQSDGENVQNQV